MQHTNASSDTHASPRLLPLASLVDEWDADAQIRWDASQKKTPLGALTGLPKLDQMLGNELSPGMHILHGVPGAGKTALALQIAANCGCPCLYVTCEMSPLELLRRHTARVTGTYLGRLKTGELHPEQSKKLVRDAIRAAPRLALLDATQAPLPVTGAGPDRPGLLEFTQALPNLDPGSPHRLVIVDSLHSWAEGIAGGASEYEALNAALAGLRGVAGRIGCPILAIAERNRSSMDKGGLSAGAGTRRIEYGAESVLDLDVEKEAKEDVNGEKPVTLRPAKNRNGSAGRPIALLFNGALQRLREAD